MYQQAFDQPPTAFTSAHSLRPVRQNFRKSRHPSFDFVVKFLYQQAATREIRLLESAVWCNINPDGCVDLKSFVVREYGSNIKTDTSHRLQFSFQSLACSNVSRKISESWSKQRSQVTERQLFHSVLFGEIHESYCRAKMPTEATE